MTPDMICPLIATLTFVAGAALACLVDLIDRGQTESRRADRITHDNPPEQTHDHQ